jgi:DNA replication ATP-dependent helicase Dna2
LETTTSFRLSSVNSLLTKRELPDTSPPQVRNGAARKGGLDVSLFKRLSDAHPAAVVNLTHQYRMNSDIMLLSNELVYSGQLKVGDTSVGERKLDVRKDLAESSTERWVRDIVDPELVLACARDRA